MFRLRPQDYRDIAAVLMADPDRQHYGYDTAKAAGRRSPVAYRVLNVWFERGWVRDGWEEVPAGEKRPPRRYYAVAGVGRDGMAEMLEMIR